MSRYSARARDEAVLLAGLAWAVAMVALLTAATSGCGGAQITGGAACSTLMVAIGERHDYTPERAVADIQQVSEVCHRLAAAPDAGTP